MIEKILPIIDAIQSRIDELKKIVATKPDQPAVDLGTDPEAPYGRTLDGNPRPAPMYSGGWALWNAAQRERWPTKDGSIFSIFRWLPGLQQSKLPGMDSVKINWVEVNDAILELTDTSAGKEWLSHPENVAMLDRDIAIQLTGGYFVKHPDGRLERRPG